VRSEQTRLRGFGSTAGTVGFRTFAGETVSILPGFGKQGEDAWDKGKFVLGHGQAAFASFHGGAPL